MAIIVFTLTLISGSFIGIVFNNKKFEEILPITSFSMILIMFFSGIWGKLELGPIVILCLVVLFYSIAFVYILRNKKVKEVMIKIWSPGFLFFLLCAVIFLYVDYGLLVVGWDEFTHWADIVKAMTMVDDFGTSYQADSLFQAYPPGMSLFQYFLQKLQLYFGKGFSEWKLYYAYQMFIVTIVSPLFAKCSFKHVLNFVLTMVTVIVAPMVFFPYVYSSTYIDPVLGILSGMGLAVLWLWDKKDKFSIIYISLLCSMLVLMKDVGLVFALLLLIAEVIVQYKEDKKKAVLFCVLSSLAVAIPKFLWSYYLKVHAAERVFSDHLNIQGLLHTVLTDSNCYQRKVFRNFFVALKGDIPFLFGETELEIPYPVIAILIMVGLVMINKSIKLQEHSKKMRGNIIVTIAGIQLFLYIIGLSITYAVNFSSYEALNLASFDRYMNIVFLSVWFLLVVGILYGQFEQWKQKIIVIVVGIIIISGLPWQEISWMGTRYLVKNREMKREKYVSLCEKIDEIPDEGANIYIISQESDGYDYWLLKFCARPHHVNGYFTWSIGEKFSEEDMYTLEIDVVEWKEELKRYDYVALYNLNDYFYQNFSSAFANPEDIEENQVYVINKQTGLLEKNFF